MEPTQSITDPDNNIEKSQTGDAVSKNKSTNVSIVYALGIVILTLFVSNVFFVYHYFASPNQNEINTIDKLSSNTTQKLSEQDGSTEKADVNTSSYYPIDGSTLLTLQETDRYPYQINLVPNFVSQNEWEVTISSLDELRKTYEQLATEGCGGVCSILIADNNLQKQFDILEEVSTLENCNIENLSSSNLDEFVLFDSGPGSKALVDTIYNSNLGVCGVKLVGHDGYDSWLGNYKYHAGFIKDDKVVEVKFNLFPIGKFQEIDQIWTLLGYNFETNTMDAEGMEKMYEYMNTIQFEEGVVKELIDTYDRSTQSFQLND